MDNQYKNIIVKSPKQKQTIYSYLKMNNYSENFLKNLRKEFGFILLNGENCFINEIVNDGDTISINLNPNTKTSVYSCIIPLDVVYEDDEVLVVNKPSMMATMPSKSHFKFNLCGAIMGYMEKKDSNFVVRIINRLDKEACGMVLVAKNSLSANFLNQNGNVDKTYYALCEGTFNDDKIKIEKSIETLKNINGINLNKRATSISGKSAKTYVNLIKNYSNYSLIKINLEHGRTHQIRVHLSSIGHPLLGDSLYGEKSEFISHTALCCKEMSFVHPATRQRISLEIPFPEDFIKLIFRN